MSRRRVNRSSNASDLSMPDLSAQRNNVCSMPAIQISIFSGEEENLNFFIQQLEEVAQLSNWSQQYLLVYAKSKLGGKAKRLIQQATELNKVNSFADFVKILKNFFSTNNQFASHVLAFNSFKMLPGESINNLVLRLDMLVSKVHPDITDGSILDKIKLTKFLEIVPSSMRLFLLQNDTNTFEEAVKKANTFQNCMLNNTLLEANCTENEIANNHTINALHEKLDSLTQRLQSFENKNDVKAEKPKQEVVPHNKFRRKKFGRQQGYKPYERQSNFSDRSNNSNFHSRGSFNRYKGGFRPQKHNQVQDKYVNNTQQNVDTQAQSSYNNNHAYSHIPHPQYNPMNLCNNMQTFSGMPMHPFQNMCMPFIPSMPTMPNMYTPFFQNPMSFNLPSVSMGQATATNPSPQITFPDSNAAQNNPNGNAR